MSGVQPVYLARELQEQSSRYVLVIGGGGGISRRELTKLLLCSVLQGVNKHNGETVAVKTFNQLSHMRPQEVQMREFEVCQHGMISAVIAFLIVPLRFWKK